MNLVKDGRGFSLLEVLLAICFLAIGMMSLATLQSRGIRGNDLANRTTQAAALAQIKLEEHIHRSRSETFAAGTTNDPDNPIDETENGGGIFSRSWTIQNDTPASGAQTVSVTVSWNDIAGQHNLVLNGVITSDSH
jgi:Tfp pilus assembly protein PilV